MNYSFKIFYSGKMCRNLLFILVEGDDDERFFDKILKPFFNENDFAIKIWQYAQRTKRIKDFIKSINSMNAFFIIFHDHNDCPCISFVKEKVLKLAKIEVDSNYIFIVKKEIESWYLAGISNELLKKYKIRKTLSTENISKERFNDLIPKKISKLSFISDIIKDYNLNLAQGKNNSLKYLIDNFSLKYN